MSRGFRAPGLRNPVGRFDSCTTYWFGKGALRKRIQNYVVLTLPSMSRDDELEIYRPEASSEFEDRTQDIEDRL